MSYGNRVKNVSFQLRRGEVLGISGLVGAGRSELVETIFGMRKKSGGEIFVDGKPVQINHPRHAIRNKIALITEDRKFTGLNLIGTVAENITIVNLGRLFRNGLINRKKEREIADIYIDKLSIRTPNAQQQVANLSGGNQQKVVIAKWLLSEPDVIILD